MGTMCLICGNEKKRRFGSAKHTCDCEEVRRRAGQSGNVFVVE